MSEKVNMQSKKDYLNLLKKKYSQSKVKEIKSEIINEAISNLGYSRKYAIYKLNGPPESVKKQTRKRQNKYPSSLKHPLKTIWEVLNKPCSKRLKEMIPEMVRVLKKFDEIQVTEEERVMLCKMGNWKIEDLLKEEKRKFTKGKTGTKASKYLLNKKIKIRTNFDDVEDPGNLESDTVHHCGDKLIGTYAVTLNNIDIETLWTEQECFLSCRKRNVISGVDNVRKRFPFTIQSIDFDNGGEFKNYHFLRYCQRNKISTTRSRSYKKNDQCYVEGNNYTDVRELIGYKRYENQNEVDIINDVYRNEHRLLNNFFYAPMKLQEKVRDGAKVTKKYDKAKTPFQRVLDSQSKNITDDIRNNLKQEYEKLNPAELKRNLDKKLIQLQKLRLENKTKQ